MVGVTGEIVVGAFVVLVGGCCDVVFGRVVIESEVPVVCGCSVVFICGGGSVDSNNYNHKLCTFCHSRADVSQNRPIGTRVYC